MSESTSSYGSYAEGLKWVLTIATAAIAGAFLHIKEIEAESGTVQVFIALALSAFVVCAWAGMHYLMWFNLVALRKERIKENQTAINETDQTEAGLKRRESLQKRIDSDTRDIQTSERTMPTWYGIFTYAFSGALVFALLGIFISIGVHASIADHSKGQEDPKKVIQVQNGSSAARDRFHIVYSAIHAAVHGKEPHTFLINDERGEVWQMVCQDKEHVTFQKIPVVPEPKN